MALSLLVGMFTGAVAGAFVTTASATTPAACTASPASTTTCAVTLAMTSGTWAVHGGTSTTFPATSTTGLVATENPASGAITGSTLSLPVTPESNTGSTETISFDQVTSGAATGSISAKGQVTITAQLEIVVNITKPDHFSCRSQPVTVKLQSTTAYDASTGDVTLSDTTFAIPDFADAPTYTCGAALTKLNETFPGPTGNALTLNLHGTLLVPPTPSVSSATTLSVKPKVPAATGGTVAGQTTTLTATVAPGGTHGVTGSVQFMYTAVDLGTPVKLVTGSGTATATLTTKTLPIGVNHLTAVYSGNGTYFTSTSATTTYTVVASPTVNVNFPSSVTTTTNGTTGGFASTSPTKFTGVIGDPISNGPTLSRARLTFALSGVTGLTAAMTKLAVCTTTTAGVYSGCTTVTLSATLTGHYGGTTSTSTFTLTPGTQKRLYFELAFTSKTTTDYGRLVIATTLTTVTAAGIAVQATLATQTATIDTLRSTSPAPTRLTVAKEADESAGIRQGDEYEFTATVAKAADGPTPSGIVTLSRALASAPAITTPIGSILLPTKKTLTVAVTWSVGTYLITATYGGDPFYSATNTTAPFALKVTAPVTGVLYVCAESGEVTSLRAYVTSVGGGTLPSSAPVGSALTVTNLSVTANFASPGFGTASAAMSEVSVGFTPEGEGTGILPTGQPDTGVSPTGVAVDPKTHTAYVTNAGSGNVSVIDETTGTITAIVPVGTTPTGVAVDSTAGPTGTIYVANHGSKSISVIDGATNKVTDTVTTTVGTDPAGVAVDPATGTIYVANEGSSSVSVLDGATDKVTDTIAVTATPHGVAVDPTTGPGGIVYVAHYGSGNVSAIDGATKAVDELTVSSGTRLWAVAVDPKTDKVYVTGEYTTYVVVLKGGSTPTPTRTITAGRTPYGVAVDPTAGPIVGGIRQGTVYVTNDLGDTVSVFAGTATAITTTIPVGDAPGGVAVDPTAGSTGTAYVTNPRSQTVSVIDGATKTVARTVDFSAGSYVIPVVTGVSKPLTAYGTFLAQGTTVLSGSAGDVTVGLASFGWIRSPGAGTYIYTCTPVTAPATIGTVDALALTAPTVTTQPTGQTVDVGKTATFSATASGVPAPTAQWQSSPNGATWTDIAGATQATKSTTATVTTTTYTTTPTTGADSTTQYRAVFTNGSGSTPSNPATLTVNVPPTITEEPTNQVVTAGTTVTFSAAASAHPTPSVQWYVSTDRGKSFSPVGGAHSPTLTFRATQRQNGNDYKAVFTNTLGSATTTAATLRVTTTAYRLVGADGAVYDFGTAQFYGSMGGQPLNKPIVGTATTPTGGGYWLVASDGGIFSFGTAQFYGSMGGQPLNKPIVGMASTPTGGGYWEVASDGGIFAFGNAQFYGSMGGQHLNQPIVDMAATPTGGGYWLVASDGGIFAFGNAQFYGSTGSMTLNKPIVGMAATPTGRGYWLVASDGGIFSFGNAPFEGSAAGGSAGTIVGMAATTTGRGYWLAGANGSVTAFGNAPLAGSMAGQPLNAPIVGMTG